MSLIRSVINIVPKLRRKAPIKSQLMKKVLKTSCVSSFTKSGLYLSVPKPVRKGTLGFFARFIVDFKNVSIQNRILSMTYQSL